MKILLISPLNPLPLEKGGAVRVWNIAKELSNSHQVDLFCFIRNEREWRYESDLKKVFRNVHMVLRKEIISPRVLLESGWRKLFFFQRNFKLVFGSLFSNKSVLSLLYEHDELVRYVEVADAEREYDMIYLETYYVGSSLYDRICRLKTPILLCEQNIEYQAYGRQARQQRNFFVRILMQIDVWKMKVEEVLLWKQVPRLAGLSMVDVRVMKEATGREDVMMIENGVDVGWFSEKKAKRVDHQVLFVGSFAYFPNVDAVKWLIDEIWPKVLERLTDKSNKLELRIVGRSADNDLKAYVQHKGFQIDEGVDDIRFAFQEASLLVAPLLAGSGTKYKVLEAMASHCPVVTTKIGAEGLDLRNGKEVFVADTAVTIAENIVEMLENREKANIVAENAYEYVKSKYDWREVVGVFNRDFSNL